MFNICKIKSKLNKSDLNIEGKTPVYSSESENNGIIGYTKKSPSFLVNDNQLVYIVFGDHSRNFNIASDSFCVADNVKVLSVNGNISVKSLLFITASWKKCIPNKGYSRHWSLAKNVSFKLPVKNNEIDFEFMEEIIKELEKERVNDLEDEKNRNIFNYINEANLKNIELSNYEESLLIKFKNDEIEFKNYKINEIFDVVSSKKIYHANKIEEIFDKQLKGSLPYVVRKTKNNGVRGYILEDKKFANHKNTLSFAQDTFTVFYQKQDYFTGNKVKILKPKFTNINEEILQYLASSIQKSVMNLSWGIGSTVESIGEIKVKLPTKNNDIDFTFIR